MASFPIPGVPGGLSFSGGSAHSGDASAGSSQSGGAWNVNLGGSGADSGSGNPGNPLGSIPPVLLYAALAFVAWKLLKR